MSEYFQAWCDDKGIKLVLVPKEAHHQLGLVERLHAVPRQQLYKMKSEKPDLKLDVAVLHACDQRNRLRLSLATHHPKLASLMSLMEFDQMDIQATWRTLRSEFGRPRPSTRPTATPFGEPFWPEAERSMNRSRWETMHILAHQQ